MRIGLVTEFYYPHLGGVTEHVHNLAIELERRGHDPVVITSVMQGLDHPDPHFVRRVGTSRVIYSSGSFARVTTGWRLTERLEDLFRRERLEVLHIHGGLAPTFGLVAATAAHRLDLPVVATFHSWFPRSALYRVFRRPLQERLDRHAAVIAVSQPVVAAHGRYFRADWEVIPNGIDTTVFHPAAGSRPAQAPGPRLLFLGRLDPRNGLDTVLRALPRVLQVHPGARLTVAGDGPLRGVYERLARPVAASVDFVGRVNGERPKHYASADLYLCPTTKASFGITLLESMACATPMIVSDITGFRELVNHGREAALVPPGRPECWAQTILELLGDTSRRADMGRAGRAKALDYGWPHITDRVLRVYQRVR